MGCSILLCLSFHLGIFFFWLLFLKGYWLFKTKELKMKISLAHEGKRLILFPLHLLFAVLGIERVHAGAAPVCTAHFADSLGTPHPPGWSYQALLRQLLCLVDIEVSRFTPIHRIRYGDSICHTLTRES